VIGIELEAVNFAAEYKERVFSAFLAEYRDGRTPNPDVLCTPKSSSRPFSISSALGAGRHRHLGIMRGRAPRCAREKNAGRFELLKAADKSKDQSYFLYRLSQAQLASAMFPLRN